MPRPPILEPIDYKALFEGGQRYRQWLAMAESEANATKMDDRRAALFVSPATAAFLQNLPRVVHVLAIAEDWCGDVHLHVPVLARLEEESAERVLVRYVSRADHKGAFARFLTNGGEAIPKFVFFNDSFIEVGNWGPMPEACRKLIARGKAIGDVRTARERVSAMYSADPHGLATQRELLELIDIAAATFV